MGYEDFDLISKSVSNEEQRLKDLSQRLVKYSNDEVKVLHDISEAKKMADAEEYTRQVKNLESLRKKREEEYSRIKTMAIRNIMDQSEIERNELEKTYLERIDLEKLIHDKKEAYLKSESTREKNSLKKQIEESENELKNLNKKEQYLKSEYERRDKIITLINKEQTLLKVGDKKAAKKLDIEKKKLEIEEKREKLDRQLETGEITKESYEEQTRDIRKLERQVSNSEALSKYGETLEKQMKDTFGKMFKGFSDGINEAIEDVTSHRLHVMTRLQGFGGDEYNYSGLMDTVSKNLAVSPYVTQREFMKKLDEAVDKGIAYNVEQRTFLATISDEIATTFDAFDSNLLRLIKLQQADSTAARLGMEAALTKTLNSVFSDSSYLTDEIYKSVRGALVESESLMNREAATEFEYVVQKWLGSLYSLGASNSLIGQISQGINYLGTGNVGALANNSPLQTLFAMSASRANLDYANLLVGGLTTENTNALLKSMVEYLKEIAEDNKNNNVVKSAYGDLYNMSLADMKAIASLSSGDISSIYADSMSYSSMGDSLTQQFSSLSNRFSTSEMIKNVVDNFIYSLGSEITQNAVTYTMWEITDLINKSTGGIHLPAISIFGNMVDLSSFTVEGIIKSGLVGYATLGQIGNIISSINSGGGLDLSNWGGTDTIQRGQITTQKAGSVNTTSGSTYVGSSSSTDMKNASIAGATDEAMEVSEITNAGTESEYTFDDFYRTVLIDKEPLFVKSAEEFTVSDLYQSIYKDRMPVPIEVSTSTKIGSMLEALASYMLSSNKITDVNIKKSDITIPSSIQNLDQKFKEELKNYIKTVYLENLATELKESLIGTSKGFGGATIAKVCDKIMNDRVDVEVKNDGFDMFLANSYALHG